MRDREIKSTEAFFYVAPEPDQKYLPRLAYGTHAILVRQTEKRKIVYGAQLGHKIVCLDENATAEVVQLGEDRRFVKDPNVLINVRTK